MATGVQNAWSTTAASNATADTAVNAAEGQAPSTINDSMRSIMALIKKYVKDQQGVTATGGTSTAYTLTSNETITLADGVTVTARMSVTSGASPTLNVDSTGAVAIQAYQGTAIPTGYLLAGGIYTFTYYASVAAWITQGYYGISTQPYVSGTKTLFFQTSAPTGWTKDTSLDNGTVRLVSGSVGADAGTANFTSVFTSRTISQGNLPNVSFSHSLTAATHTHTVTGAGARHGQSGADPGTNFYQSNGDSSAPVNAQNSMTSSASGALAVSGTVSSGGSGTALDFAVKYADAIRASIN